METLTEKKAANRTDAEILADVLRDLQWNRHIPASQIGVDVRNGLVTLIGSVESYIEKLHAVRAAHRVRGVLDVADEIEVRYSPSQEPSDAVLARAVRHTLEWDAFVADQKIHSTVSEGYVTLEGEVAFVSEREDADRAVRRLKGVRGVINKITVTPARVDSAKVRQAIEETLERRAEREADRIAVDVKDGVVTLTGRVHSWQEKESIAAAVGHAPGVHRVEDHLRVQPWF